MNLKRTLGLGVGGGAVAVWIAAAATSVSPPTPIAPRVDARAIESSGAELAAEITRLHERLRPSATPLHTRDLFQYAPHAAAVSAPRQSRPVGVEAAAPIAPVFALTLIGIAEDGPVDHVVRTAIVSGPGDLYLVKEGDTLASRYRVVAIGADAVELGDVTDQSLRRLTLR